MAKEFDIESFATEEKMMLDNFATDSTNNVDPILIDSSGPVTAAMEIEMQNKAVRRYIYIYLICYASLLYSLIDIL